MASEGLMTLIESYLSAIHQLSNRVQSAYGMGNLLTARRAGKIPRIGNFGKTGEFQFHGIGCTISEGPITVNFDFFTDGRTDGFDAWRLHNFATNNIVTWDPKLNTSLSSIKTELDKLAAMGRITAVEGSNLYRIAASTDD